VTDWSCCCKC